MNVRIRLTQELYDRVRADLSRSHPFAAERVGFLFGRLGNARTAALVVVLTEYAPLADDRYINDPMAGARIDSQAIRGAMQQVINRCEGAFHVHMHESPGKPRFSPMDCDELPRLIPSFQVVGPSFAHGLLLLSKDECAADVWLPGENRPIKAAMITVVGYPLQFFDGGDR